MERIKLTLSYHGARYSGWQIQPIETASMTVQGSLEEAIERVVGKRVIVHASGRTDAGVHALAQVCHFDCPSNRMGLDWKSILNSYLESDIQIIKSEVVADDFHARKHAKSKRYAYSIWHGEERAIPLLAPYCWSLRNLNFSNMEEASKLLVGKKDFASFQNSGSSVTSTVRNLKSIELKDGFCNGLASSKDWPVKTWLIEGDGFLRHMVRNIVGLLVWVGLGKLSLSELKKIIDARERGLLPSPTAPPQGLSLLEVFY